MTTRWPALLLLLMALAQTPALRGQPPRINRIEPERPSHRPINDGLENDASPEKRLADRLNSAKLNKEKQELDDTFREIAKQMLKDPKVRESLLDKLNSGDLKREDVKKLERVLEGNRDLARDLANDPELKKLLAEHLEKGKLSQEQKDTLQRWKENFDKGGGNVTPTTPTQPDKSKLPKQPAPAPVPQPGATPPKQDADNVPSGTPKWLETGLNDGARNFSRWLDSPSGKSFRDSLKDLGKRTGELRTSPAGEQARTTAQRLPRPSKWVPENLRPSTRRLGDSAPRLGNAASHLPRPSAPAAPSVPRVSAGSALEVILVLVLIVLLLLVAWKTRGLWKSVLLSLTGSSGWRLGPWPVRPGEVATRRDLVRAFEYLALLCLGPAARAHHHLDLAQLIAEQPALDPDRRREAATTLARLYEQARYTPDDELLSPRDVEDARRELAYLADHRGTAA